MLYGYVIFFDLKAPLFALVLTFGYLSGTVQEVFESYADELGTQYRVDGGYEGGGRRCCGLDVSSSRVC